MSAMNIEDEIAQLRAIMIEAERKISKLDPNNDTYVKRRIAPDGGPMSDAHKYLKPEMTRTVLIRRKLEDGSEVELLQRADLVDPTRDTVVDKTTTARPRVPVTPVKPKPSGVSTHTREEMLTMTLKALSALPEVNGNPDIPAGKTELVDKILEIRTERSA